MFVLNLTQPQHLLVVCLVFQVRLHTVDLQTNVCMWIRKKKEKTDKGCAWESQGMCVFVCVKETYVIISHFPPPQLQTFLEGWRKPCYATGLNVSLYIRNSFALIENNNQYQDLMPDRGQIKVTGLFQQTASFVFLLSSGELLLPPYLSGLIYQSRILVPHHFFF